MESLTSYLNREKSKQEMSKSLIARRRILRSKRSGTKSFFAFWPRVNWSESKKRRSGGWWGKGGNACPQIPRF